MNRHELLDKVNDLCRGELPENVRKVLCDIEDYLEDNPSSEEVREWFKKAFHYADREWREEKLKSL